MKIIVRAPNWLGDAVLALPAIESLTRSQPEVKIWIAGREWLQDLFLPLEFVYGFIPLPASSHPKDLWKAANLLRKQTFDAGLLLTNSFASAFVFFLAGIPQRWGYARDGRGILLTKRVRSDRKSVSHQLEYYLALVAMLGFDVSRPEFSLTLDEKRIRQAQDRLKALNINFDKPIVVINPGAAYGPVKRWPPLRFAELASRLQERKGAQILIIGSAEERSIAEAIAAGMKTKPIVLSGKTTLRELAGLLQQATLLVTNDTGPMHMANALKVPVVAIFGPTDPDSTGPFQEPATVVFERASCWPCKHRECPIDHKCLSDISAEDVFRASERFLT